jgi:hypothetical protein
MTSSLQADRPMTSGKISVAVVGGGRRCLSLLQMLESDALKGLKMEIVGVADIDPEAVGLVYAKSMGIFTTSDFRTLFGVPNLEMVINLTGSPEVTHRLAELSPPAVTVLPASRLSCSRNVQEALTASRQMDEQADKIFRPSRPGIAGRPMSVSLFWIQTIGLFGSTTRPAVGPEKRSAGHFQVSISRSVAPRRNEVPDEETCYLCISPIYEHRTLRGKPLNRHIHFLV